MSGHRPIAPCGTKQARARHRRRGEEICDACTPKPQQVSPCGTANARRRHARNNEQCNACGPIVGRTAPAPCGTRQAAKRHKRFGETCTICPTIGDRQPVQPCGTPGAWRRHKRRNETPCKPCTEAIRASNRERKQKANNHKPRPEIPTIQNLTEEIVFLLNAGEGTHRILNATGYTGRERALRSLLHKHGHHDLANRVLNPWELAA